MEIRIRPLSSPCSRGFAVSGRWTSGPLCICGATTMKMISSTSTTSTSGVTLMADWILAGLTGRMGRPRGRFRHLEQEVHEFGGSLVHLDHGAEQADERGRRADRRQKPETPLHLDQRLLLGVVERGRDDVERIVSIASGLAP